MKLVRNPKTRWLHFCWEENVDADFICSVSFNQFKFQKILDFLWRRWRRRTGFLFHCSSSWGQQSAAKLLSNILKKKKRRKVWLGKWATRGLLRNHLICRRWYQPKPGQLMTTTMYTRVAKRWRNFHLCAANGIAIISQCPSHVHTYLVYQITISSQVGPLHSSWTLPEIFTEAYQS